MWSTNLIAGAMLMGAVTTAATFNEVPTDADLVVHVYDKVEIAKLEFGSAKRQAARLLANAGIKVRFVDCLIGPTGKCDDTTDPRTIIMSIEGTVPDRLRTALGYALPYTERANRATLNYPRIEKTSPFHTECLLGTVIAHELAHLLFRSTAHGSGMMKDKWTAEDIKAMSENRLGFSPEQAYGLRAGLQARLNGTVVAVNRLP